MQVNSYDPVKGCRSQLQENYRKYSDTIHIQEILEQFFLYICASFYEIYIALQHSTTLWIWTRDPIFVSCTKGTLKGFLPTL